MPSPEQALLGVTSLIIMVANYGLFKWFAARMDDDGHRGPLAASSTGTLLATSMWLMTGPGITISIVAIVPWLMVSFFTWPENKALSMGAGAGAWALWWAIQSGSRAFASLQDLL